MALKRKIDKATYDTLSDDLKAEYKQDGDNYVLDVEDSGFDALKEEKRREKERADALQARLDKDAADKAAAEEKARKEAEKAAKAAGDVEALEKSWKEKYDRDLQAEKDKTKASTAALEAVFVNKVARDMAEKISTVPDLLIDQIKKRLTVETTDETPITRVLDAAGQPSAANLADLEKEFLDNPAYKAIIKASDANGGGAGGGNANPGGASKKLSEMTATEEAKFANEHPDEYARLVAGG